MGDQPASIMVERVLEQLRLLPNDVDDLSGTLAGYLHLNRTDLRALKVLRDSDGVTAGDAVRRVRWTNGGTPPAVDSLVHTGHPQPKADEAARGHSRRLSRAIS